MWLALAGVDNTLANKKLLTDIVNAVKGHAGLGVWKGADEPAHGHIAVSGLVAVLKHVRSLDPDHPLAIIEAPRNPSVEPGGKDRVLTAAAMAPYAATCDIHGVDIYPVSVPPGKHAGRANTDISVVGDVTRILAAAKPGQPIWTTLQIAWSGVLPPRPVVFPTLQQARFMAYDAIIAGARGLFFFGGHIRQVMTPQDRVRGFNWTYWRKVQKPLTQELAGPQHVAALLAPDAPFKVTANAPDIALSARQTGRLGLPDRRSAQPDRERPRPVPGATRRDHRGNRSPARPEQSAAHVRRQGRCVHRCERLRAAQRARLPVPAALSRWVAPGVHLFFLPSVHDRAPDVQADHDHRDDEGGGDRECEGDHA